jgi:hypothetical protein
MNTILAKLVIAQAPTILALIDARGIFVRQVITYRALDHFSNINLSIFSSFISTNPLIIID